jgi:hypothetical protein
MTYHYVFVRERAGLWRFVYSIPKREAKIVTSERASIFIKQNLRELLPTVQFIINYTKHNPFREADGHSANQDLPRP